MKARMSRYETLKVTGIVAIMLAIPFSCLLARAWLSYAEHRPEALASRPPLTA